MTSKNTGKHTVISSQGYKDYKSVLIEPPIHGNV